MTDIEIKGKTYQGIITRLLYAHGYGFIKEDSGKSIFLHASKVISPTYEELKEGDKVEFLIIETPKGLQGIDIVSNK